MMRTGASYILLCGLLCTLFCTPLNAKAVDLIQAHKPIPPILTQLFQGLTHIQFESKLDDIYFNIRNRSFSVGKMSFESTVLLNEVLRQSTFGPDRKPITHAFLPDFLIGKPETLIHIKSELRADGEFTALINFFERDKVSFLAVEILTRTLGVLNVQLRSLSFKASHIQMNEKFLDQDIRIQGKCDLDIEKAFFKNKAKIPTQESENIDCNIQLHHDPSHHEWAFELVLRPSQKEFLPDFNQKKFPPPNPSVDEPYCVRPQDYVQENLKNLWTHYKNQNESLPTFFSSPAEHYVSYSGSFSKDRSKNEYEEDLKLAFYLQPTVRQFEIPGAPFGLFAEIDKGTIVGFCYDSIASKAGNDYIVVDFYRKHPKYGFFGGPEVITRSDVNFNWHPIREIAHKWMDKENEDVSAISKFFRSIASPILEIPIQLLNEIVPVHHIERIILSKKDIRFYKNNKLLKIIPL